MDFDRFMQLYMPGPDLPSELEIPTFSGCKAELGKSKDFAQVELVRDLPVSSPGEAVVYLCKQCRVALAIFDSCPYGEKLAASNLRDSPDSSDRNSAAAQRRVDSDVSFYPAAHIDARADHASTPGNLIKDFRTSSRWAWISLFVEIKTTSTHQCASEFADRDNDQESDDGENPADGSDYDECRDDSDQPTAADTGKGQATNASDDVEPDENALSGPKADDSLERMAECVGKIFKRQHRLHLFTLLMFNGQARVTRWDRAGATVSASIDFKEDPSPLHKVIWRYACMDQERRGFDPTVVRATQDEIDAMRDCGAPNEWVSERRHAALDQAGWPVYKIKMRTEDLIDQRDLQPLTKWSSPEPEDTDPPASDGASFIVGKPYFATDSPIGRGTKGYIAYDVSRKRLVFLKDCWRPRVEHSSGVQYVPTPIAAGVVKNDAGSAQETSAQCWQPADQKTTCRWPIQEHYRLVVKEICEPLESHSSPRELVKCIFEALQAHKQAWELERCLHGDISPANILILRFIDMEGIERVVGILNDWEMCKLIKDDTVLRPGRTGTWRYMSARLLQDPGKVHEVADDLESVVHVLNWMCLRFVKHALTSFPDALRIHVLHMYDHQSVRIGDKHQEKIGGDLKKTFSHIGLPSVKIPDPGSPLAELLAKLALMCQQHYEAVDPRPKARPKQDEEPLEPILDMPLPVRIKRPIKQVPSVDASETLADHNDIYYYFYTALQQPLAHWKDVVGTADQFQGPEFGTIVVYWRGPERSNVHPTGLKRTLNDLKSTDLERPGPSKRHRGRTSDSEEEDWEEEDWEEEEYDEAYDEVGE
ncbi:uncharacterized protein B0H18DRAFT_987214 [Fomitopsis serialis]|uniref:uncharacterized protein n=1 Tax=Fomitopsis serialis TaxID=139415 RepID=UPI002007A9A4|nr:uncharacterized protein B0H18DRAFT_987214 [Neoantrodia serialis]KAH9932239.1 hypothetical protein B0H18DRAFT_987214 [Neoantrodia serialis]